MIRRVENEEAGGHFPIHLAWGIRDNNHIPSKLSVQIQESGRGTHILSSRLFGIHCLTDALTWGPRIRGGSCSSRIWRCEPKEVISSVVFGCGV